MTTLFVFIILLSILVLVHEFGHFYIAKKIGMRVYEFGLGYPPRLFGFYKDEKTGKWKYIFGKGKNKLKDLMSGETEEKEFSNTLYSINWLPLGGFVRIKGENGENSEDKDSFIHHVIWKRSIVLVAGVFMNIVAAAVLFSFGFMIGLPADLSQGVDKYAIILQQPSVMIQQVQKDTPAESAGFVFGDKILKIDNTKILSSNEMIEYIRQNGIKKMRVLVEREGKQENISVIPAIVGNETTPRLGLVLADAGIIKYPWYIAIYKGILAAIMGIINIFIALFYLVKNLAFGNGLVFDIAGPVGIASLVGKSAKMGLHYLINVSAMISLSLAAINILPIPALDGGRLLFLAIEKIIRRPVPMKYEQLAHTAGFALLMLLIVVVTWRDIANLL
jgi:regulator of sigma E protease